MHVIRDTKIKYTKNVHYADKNTKLLIRLIIMFIVVNHKATPKYVLLC